MRVLGTFSVILLSGAFLCPPSHAADDGDEFDPVHHTANGFYLDFMPFGKVELPRLFLVRDEGGALGLDFFFSTASALRSEKYVAETEGDAHAEESVHAGEGVADIESLIASGAHLDAHLAPVAGQSLLDLSMSRHLAFALLSSAILLVVFLRLAGMYARGIGRKTSPRGKFQNLLEILIIFVRDDIALLNLGRERYKAFLPYLLTVFFFILTCNLLGLVPFGATATSNLMITCVLAAFTFVLTQFNGSKAYWRHVFWPPGMPVAVKLLLIPTEIMGLFTKPMALAIRLFANMTAGHLVILCLIGMIFTFGQGYGPVAGYGIAPLSVAFTLFVNLLEILIAFIQAYIFTILSALFIGMAIADHSHEEAHETVTVR